MRVPCDSSRKGGKKGMETSMNSRRVFWMAIGAGAWLFWGGLSQSKTISPATPRPTGDTLRVACPEVPKDTTPIAGLHTAWAMYDWPSGGIRLVFSDHAVPCRDLERLGGPMGQECATSWQFAFTLPAEAKTPGTYNLHDHEANYAEAVSVAMPAEGCQSDPGCMGGGMGSAGGAKGPDSAIEIYSVSEECVTGRIVRLERGMMTPQDFDFTGTFQAVACKPTPP
jgi:hypothetical protein